MFYSSWSEESFFLFKSIIHSIYIYEIILWTRWNDMCINKYWADWWNILSSEKILLKDDELIPKVSNTIQKADTNLFDLKTHQNQNIKREALI